MYRIISFGTPSKTYRGGLNKIRRSCREFNIPYHLWLIDPVLFKRPGWHGKVLYKPTFIREMIEGYNETVVWMDADCWLLDRFTLPEGDWDIGVVPHQLERNRIHFTPWIVSLLAIRPTKRAKLVLHYWEKLCKTDGRESDHERFIATLEIVGCQIQNILPYVRGKVYLDPRHRKRSKLTYEEMPAELDNWYLGEA